MKNFAVYAASVLCLILVGIELASSQTIVYVSSANANKICSFILLENGNLVPNGNTSIQGGPGPLAVDPAKEFLYVALNSAIATYSIQAGGALSLVGVSPIVDIPSPVMIETDANGEFLLVAYWGEAFGQTGKIAIYPVDLDGTILSTPTQVLVPCLNPHSIWHDTTNKFVYVPCMGSDEVLQYVFDHDTGTLKPNTPAFVPTPKGAGPRHLTFHPNGKIVYVIDELGNTMTTYAKATDGTLQQIQLISTLPPDWNGTDNAADVHITPDAAYLYGSNRGNNSIVAFTVDKTTSLLTYLGVWPTVNWPRAFNIDPSGKWLISAGQLSGTIREYAINKDGTLTILRDLVIGDNLLWVLFVTDPIQTNDASLSTA